MGWGYVSEFSIWLVVGNFSTRKPSFRPEPGVIVVGSLQSEASASISRIFNDSKVAGIGKHAGR